MLTQKTCHRHKEIYLEATPPRESSSKVGLAVDTSAQIGQPSINIKQEKFIKGSTQKAKIQMILGREWTSTFLFYTGLPDWPFSGQIFKFLLFFIVKLPAKFVFGLLLNFGLVGPFHQKF